MYKKILKSLLLVLTVSTLSYNISFASLNLNTKLNSTGKEVTELQSFLITKGFLSGTPTGYYGSLTTSAVKLYQKSVGIESTGTVGPLTRKSINNSNTVSGSSIVVSTTVSTSTKPVAASSTTPVFTKPVATVAKVISVKPTLVTRLTGSIKGAISKVISVGTIARYSYGGGGGGGGSVYVAPTPTPVNGSCGASSGLTVSSTPTTLLCTVGSASSVSGTSTFLWSCAGTDGGSTASCSATLSVSTSTGTTTSTSTPTPVNGVCGSANGTSRSSIPSSNLCSAGATSSVTGTGPWAWSCAGVDGGTNASCGASVTSTSSGTSTVVWTPVTPVPGQVNVVSSDSTIANGTIATFGQVFPVGEIVSGRSISAISGGVALPTQVDVKRTNSDGSIRHAIISVRLPSVASSTTASIAFSLNSTTTTLSGTPLSLSSVDAGGSPIDYRVEIYEHGYKASSTNYSVLDTTRPTDESGKTWTTTLKAALASTSSSWISGPLVSEWRTRVAPTNGTSSHPGLRVIFDARYQSTNQGRVSITIENVESSAARGDRTYDIAIYDDTTGGSVVYSQSNLLHYAQTRYRKILYFGSGMKEMMSIVDSNRLKTSFTIPNYASVTIPTLELNNNYTSWQNSPRSLYEESLIRSYMPATGGRQDIGPLPGWTARAMISGDTRMYQVMFDLAERAGYFNVHWRDTLLAGANIMNADIFTLDNHPQFSLMNPSSSPDSYVGHPGYNREGDYLPAPASTITVPPGGWSPDRSHQPSFVFVPYVVTGDHFYLDELNFWAAWNLSNLPYDYREEGKGLLKAESQPRGQAWALRTMGHASWIAPTADWHGTYFASKLEENLIWYRAYILTSNSLGYWKWGDIGINRSELPFASADASKAFSPWMHHFVAYTLYQLTNMGFNAADLRDFTLGYTVKLFTSSPDYDPLDGTSYRLPTETIDGNPINTMADLSYHAFSGVSFSNRNPGWSLTLPSAGDPDGHASIAMGALAAALDAAVGSRVIESQAYVYVRNEIMNQGNNSRVGYLNNPTWNIVPFGTVVGLNEAPGIYTKP